MKRLLNWLRTSSPAPGHCAGPSFRPALESLDERAVPNATSWANGYHQTTVSAVQQERAEDRVSFAIDPSHRLTEFIGDFAFHPGTYSGAVFGGLATDIDAGRDAAGRAQVLVHGFANSVSLYNVASGWQDLTFKTRYGNRVWQISAGNSGEVYMLDTAHLAWTYEFSTSSWRLLGVGISEIQASRGSLFDPGLYTRTDSGYIGHWNPTTSWTVLGTANPHAKALSVNANNSVFIIAGSEGKVYKYNETSRGWAVLGTGDHLQAINAVTGPNHEDLVYGFIADYSNGDLHGYVDYGMNYPGLGPRHESEVNGRVWKWTAAGDWQNLNIQSDRFSGASGSTLYVVTVFSDELFPNVHRNNWATGEDTFLGPSW